MIKWIAFDLDGTLTQHKTPLDPQNRSVLDRLAETYELLMEGAGQCARIFAQMGNYPIDIIDNYGMQYSRYDSTTQQKRMVRDDSRPCDRASVSERIMDLRRRFGYTDYIGESVEFHASGCVTFPLCGTAASQEIKLRFDPDRSKRRGFYREVCRSFPEFNVFIGDPPRLIWLRSRITNTMRWIASVGRTDLRIPMLFLSGTTTVREEMTNQSIVPISVSSA